MSVEHKDRTLQDVGKCALGSLRDMVAALECDYDRLGGLKSDRDTWTPGDSDQPEKWEDAFPDEAEELKALEEEAGECTSREDAEQRIHEDALSIEVRSGWTVPGGEMEAEEFNILLTTGGPAVRIIGELRDGEPYRAWLEVQDWGTPWTEYYETGMTDICLAYARCFCFDC